MPRPPRPPIPTAIALACLVPAQGCASPAAPARPSNTPPTSQPTTQALAPSTASARGIWRDHPWPDEVLWSATREPASVAVYVFAIGGTEEKGTLPWLLAGLWPDGRAVWSDDRIEGGHPYHQGRIAPGRVRALTDRLTTLATEAAVPGTFRRPPDYLLQILQFRTPDGRVYSLGSWHELNETRGGVVTTDQGTVDLRPGQTPEQALREHASDDYRRMRRLWAALRQAINDALPQAGQPAPEDIIRFETPNRVRE